MNAILQTGSALNDTDALCKQLETKLLSLGGQRVVRDLRDPDLGRIVERGQVFSQPVRLRRGSERACHGNAARMWAKEPDRCTLVTGYALSCDVWISHNWVVDAARLYETAFKMDLYFGVGLDRFEALQFWFANGPPIEAGDQAAVLENFHRDYPQLIPLAKEIAALHSKGDQGRSQSVPVSEDRKP